MRLPNLDQIGYFCFIGPDKTGSSWLYELLRSQEGVVLPRSKELFYFDRFFSRGRRWYDANYTVMNGDHARCYGEICHDYILSREALERLYAYRPDARIIIGIRDPVERALSHYKFLARSGIAIGPIDKALEKAPEIVDNSRYSLLLPRVESLFKNASIIFLSHENLHRHPDDTATYICDSLGIERSFSFDPATRVLEASSARNRLLSYAVKKGAWGARRLRMQSAVGTIKRSAVVNRLLYRPFDSKRDASLGDMRHMLKPILAPEQEYLRARGLMGSENR